MQKNNQKSQNSTAVDRNGIQLQAGQLVRVHQDDGISVATLCDIFYDSPTVNEPGVWTDINKGDGLQGMPSYLLEVV